MPTSSRRVRDTIFVDNVDFKRVARSYLKTTADCRPVSLDEAMAQVSRWLGYPTLHALSQESTRSEGRALGVTAAGASAQATAAVSPQPVLDVVLTGPGEHPAIGPALGFEFAELMGSGGCPIWISFGAGWLSFLPAIARQHVKRVPVRFDKNGTLVDFNLPSADGRPAMYIMEPMADWSSAATHEAFRALSLRLSRHFDANPGDRPSKVIVSDAYRLTQESMDVWDVELPKLAKAAGAPLLVQTYRSNAIAGRSTDEPEAVLRSTQPWSHLSANDVAAMTRARAPLSGDKDDAAPRRLNP